VVGFQSVSGSPTSTMNRKTVVFIRELSRTPQQVGSRIVVRLTGRTRVDHDIILTIGCENLVDMWCLPFLWSGAFDPDVSSELPRTPQQQFAEIYVKCF
ncbi:hypothetical protein L195_g054725, partial [Trifolium pratense]